MIVSVYPSGADLHAVLVADRAAAARAILHDDLLPEELDQPLRHEARDEIGPAARGTGDDDADGLRGIRLRAGAGRQRAAKDERGTMKDDP